MKKRILFVDDEIKILAELQQMLRPVSAVWDMAYVKNGLEALTVMEKMRFDVVITDLSMPGMDGPKLLTEVMRRYPQTIRFVHSTQTERDKIYRSIGPAHQFLTKPANLDTIRNAIERALALRDLLGGDNLRKVVSRIGVLPILPTLYFQVVKAIESPDTSLKDVGGIIEKDLGMSAKVLQLVNSAFFGLRNHVSSPSQAASLLGLDVIKSLVVWFHVASQFHGVRSQRFSLEELQRHSSAVGTYAQAIAKHERFPRTEIDDIAMAGLFHDMGQLILAGNLSEIYEQLMSIAQFEQVPLEVEEQVKLGTTHAGIGAYLLALWGFADPIVEACYYHHRPSWHLGKTLNSVTIVYVANLFDHEFQAQRKHLKPPTYNTKYLADMKVESRVPVWRELCREIDRRSLMR